MKQFLALMMSGFVFGVFAFSAMLIMDIPVELHNFPMIVLGLFLILIGRDIADYIYKEVSK